MNSQLTQYKSFSVEEFQNNFEELMNRVENGETFVINSEHGTAIMLPFKEVVEVFEEVDSELDEIVKIHTDHEEGP